MSIKYTDKEVEILRKCLKKYESILEKTTSNAIKNELWRKIEIEYNCRKGVSVKRNYEMLRRKWHSLTNNSKKSGENEQFFKPSFPSTSYNQLRYRPLAPRKYCINVREATNVSKEETNRIKNDINAIKKEQFQMPSCSVTKDHYERLFLFNGEQPASSFTNFGLDKKKATDVSKEETNQIKNDINAINKEQLQMPSVSSVINHYERPFRFGGEQSTSSFTNFGLDMKKATDVSKEETNQIKNDINAIKKEQLQMPSFPATTYHSRVFFNDGVQSPILYTNIGLDKKKATDLYKEEINQIENQIKAKEEELEKIEKSKKIEEDALFALRLALNYKKTDYTMILSLEEEKRKKMNIIL